MLVHAHEAQGCVVSQVAFAQEGSERANRLADRYFRKFALAVPHEDIPVRLLRTSKGLREPGCEVADFVANEGGRQLRAALRKEKVFGRRFYNMFMAVPVHVGDYMAISDFSAEVTPMIDEEGRPSINAKLHIAYAPWDARR